MNEKHPKGREFKFEKQMKKWMCDKCSHIFMSDDYIPFDHLPHCPECGEKVVMSIPKCLSPGCDKDALAHTFWVYDKKNKPLMHMYMVVCNEHWQEYLEMEEELGVNSDAREIEKDIKSIKEMLKKNG